MSTTILNDAWKNCILGHVKCVSSFKKEKMIQKTFRGSKGKLKGLS